MSDSIEVLCSLTVGRVEDMIGRPLIPGESSDIAKSLEHALDEVWEDAVYSTTDRVQLAEVRASELEDGAIYRDFGDEEWTTALYVRRHGDTMLIITPDDSELTLDIDTVIQQAVNTATSEED